MAIAAAPHPSVDLCTKADERGITDPAAIGAALGLPAAEAAKLLTRHQWREGDVALLTAAAARLGVPAQGAPGAAAGDDSDPGG